MLLGERRGGLKKEHCDGCRQVVLFVLDHGTNTYRCPNCDL